MIVRDATTSVPQSLIVPVARWVATNAQSNRCKNLLVSLDGLPVPFDPLTWFWLRGRCTTNNHDHRHHRTPKSKNLTTYTHSYLSPSF